MYCCKCGRELMDNAAVCPYCGEPVRGKASAPKSRGETPTAVILGIVGFICAWCYVLVGHVVSVVGIVLGARDYRETGSKTGLILSIIAEACCVIVTIVRIVAIVCFSNMFGAMFGDVFRDLFSMSWGF